MSFCESRMRGSIAPALNTSASRSNRTASTSVAVCAAA
jgi:hypothetical protein